MEAREGLGEDVAEQVALAAEGSQHIGVVLGELRAGLLGKRDTREETIASQPGIGYPIRATMSKMEILVKKEQMMGYKIIGVHGLANKPPEQTLRDWWKKSILEGLKRNCGNTEQKVDFEIVYWADIDYPKPIPNEKNDEPYKRAKGRGKLKTYQEGWQDEVIAGVLGVAAKPLDWAKKYFGVGDIADAVLAAKLEDLSRYYENATTRDEMRGRLKEKLEKHKDKRLMLIAHSMGSIIAFDVLRAMGREDRHFQVDHLITIGSPLGLPHVKHKIYLENHLVRTPSVVKKWTNFADRRDPVALDVHLSDDYAANDYDVKVRDDLVINAYANPQGKANHHKSYGYLRAPEMSSAIRAFL